MTLSIALFELHRRIRMLSTYVYFALFFAVSFLFITAAAGTFESVVIGTGEKVFANSPKMLCICVSFIGLFATPMSAAIAGRAVQQDFEYGMSALIFTRPVAKLQYLFGRFLGAIIVSLLIFTSVGAGAWLATKMPWINADKLTHPGLWAYALPYFTLLLPNLLFTSALFFSVAAITRRMTPVYVASVILVVGYNGAAQLFFKLDNKTVASLMDPFGVVAVQYLTQYWTSAEQNTRLIPLEGMLLVNRLLWLGIAAVVAGLVAWRFSFSHNVRERPAAPKVSSGATFALHPGASVPDFSGDNGLRLVPRLSWLHFRESVKNIYFLVIVLAGVLLLVVIAFQRGQIFDTPTYPVTGQLIELFSGSFTLFALAVITFSTGELVWREREHLLSQIHDALPVRTWVTVASKILALVGVAAVLVAVIFLTCVGVQLASGYHHFEFGLYVRTLLGAQFMDYVRVVILAVAVQSLVDNKYVGHMVMVAYYAVSVFGKDLGLEHNLLTYGSTPGKPYSDMNGFGHLWSGYLWFSGFWALVALLLALLSHLLWARGMESALAVRLKLARARMTAPVKITGALGLLAALLVGSWIVYNTRWVNRYEPKSVRDEQAAQYEKRYRIHQDEPQPKITALSLDADLFPKELRANLRGTYALVNKTAQDVTFVYVDLLQHAQVRHLELGVPFEVALYDEPLGFRSLKLKTPLHPGQATTLKFDVEYTHHGFENEPTLLELAENGTFLDQKFLPQIGYQARDLTVDSQRKKHGLAPWKGMRSATDVKGQQVNAIASDADFMDFEATVTTDADQIAVAPGYLEREWTENGRRHFKYKMDSPILNIISIQSGRYAVKRDVWNGVAIEVFYHPVHDYNVDRMVNGVKASLEYYAREFGPYQHRQVRIVEYPRYATYAESLPNTIPYSEGLGFIAHPDPTNDKDVDYPFYITAHEVAHQWWAHQLVPADVKGAAFVTETLAQYSAMMVLKKRYGEKQMGRYLRHELHSYLFGRTQEPKKENTLEDVELQPYIYYRKGSLAMYALQDGIGESKVNEALRVFLSKNRFKGPPYATSRQLMAELSRVTPADHQYLLVDLFQSITLFDNRALSASARLLPDGKYEVTIKATAKKLRASDLGEQREVPMDDWEDFGALDKSGNALVLEKHRIKSGAVEVKLTVDSLPAKAGIDPLNKLVGRHPDDNSVSVQLLEST